jgi:branched-chain amino acid transport system ATP-binding protein
MTPLLSTHQLAAGYNGHPIVTDLDLAVEPGEVCALLGANGAGKTTTLLTLAGELPPIRGSATFADMPGKTPLHRRARRGLAYVPEERSVFKGMSTADNLRVGGGDVSYSLQLFPELEPLLQRKAGLLSGGEQQILTLARVLGRRPRALLIDELSLGLAPLIVVRLLKAVRRAADEDGVAVLLVEQHTEQALRVADSVLVMRRGEVVLRGRSADLAGRLEEIQAAYLSVAPGDTDGETEDMRENG